MEKKENILNTLNRYLLKKLISILLILFIIQYGAKIDAYASTREDPSKSRNAETIKYDTIFVTSRTAKIITKLEADNRTLYSYNISNLTIGYYYYYRVGAFEQFDNYTYIGNTVGFQP